DLVQSREDRAEQGRREAGLRSQAADRGRRYATVRSALARSACVLVIEPDGCEADPGPDAEQSDEHEDRQEARREPLPHAPVGRPCGREYEDAVADEDDDARTDQCPVCW